MLVDKFNVKFNYRLIFVVIFLILTFFVYTKNSFPVQSSSDYTVSSQDGLSISVSDSGKPENISISGNSLPIISGQGGFSFREIINTPNAPNMILNSSYETGTTAPLNWSFITTDGNIPTWDSTVSHTGSKSIKVSIPGTASAKSGYPKSDFIVAEPGGFYTFSAWIKTEGIGVDIAAAIRVVEVDADKNWIRQTSLGIEKGAHDWIERKTTFQASPNTHYLYMYANTWNGYGTFWIDDAFLASQTIQKVNLDGSLVSNSDKSITQKVVFSDLDFIFKYTPRDEYIEVQGDIQNLKNDERAMQVTFSLPVDALGWNWGDYVRAKRTINNTTHYENVYKIGDIRSQNIYPFSSIDNSTQGLSLAVPMDAPRIYRIGYDTNNGYTIQYDFGLSPETLKIGPGHASFKFIIYKNDEPEWEFRGVAKKYYNIYPQNFEKRVKKEGLWIISSKDMISIPNLEDFGVAFNEDGGSLKFNYLNNIYSFAYTEPWGWWRSYGTNSIKPSFDQRMADLNSDLVNGANKMWHGTPLNTAAQAVYNSAPYNQYGKMHIDTANYFWNYWSEWAQNFPTNPDPDIPSPNRFDLSSREHEYSNTTVGGSIDNWKFTTNSIWDNTISHNNSGHSAKISLITDRTDLISGNWNNDYFDVLPNTQYTFSVWMKTENASPSGGTKPSMYVVEVDQNNKAIFNNSYMVQHGLSASGPTADWHFKTLTFTSKPDAAKFFIYANIWKGNGTGWFDDVSLTKKDSTENLVKNPNFENNILGERTNFELDGMYIDSVTAGSWANLENYRKEHWHYTDIPLVFSYSDNKPILLGLLSNYEYLDKYSDNLRVNKEKLLMGNIFPYAYSFYAHKLDVLGSEIGDVEADDKASYRRIMSYQKPNSNLMQWNWKKIQGLITYDTMEKYMRSEMFYGIFPSIASSQIVPVNPDLTTGNVYTNYWKDSSLYERDRPLFKKYIPIIKQISSAGWEPIPYATSDNSNIWLERYGYADKNNLHYTLRNESASTQSGNISLDLNKLGINSTSLEVKELTTNATLTSSINNSKATFNTTINSGDTLVFKINSTIVSPTPTPTISPAPSPTPLISSTTSPTPTSPSGGGGGGIITIPTPTPTPKPSTSPSPSPSTNPDGKLLKTSDSFKVYVIISNKKKWIPTPEVFETLGYKWTNITVLSNTDLNKIPDFEDNLIRAVGNYKVYLVVNGISRHIPNPEIFLDYGFKWEEVKDVPQSTIDKYTRAILIRESRQGKIYYLSNRNIKKWIPTAEIFNSYENKWDDVQVISKKEMDSYTNVNVIKLIGDNKAYLIENNTKRWIPDANTFNKYHYNWDNILEVNRMEWEYYKTGSKVK